MKKTDVRQGSVQIVLCLLLVPTVAALGASLPGIQASGGRPSTVATSGFQEGAAPDAEALKRGQQIVESACTICHELDLVEEERLSREDWGFVIQSMLVNGSDLSDREIPLVLDYLAAAFPAESEDVSEED